MAAGLLVVLGLYELYATLTCHKTLTDWSCESRSGKTILWIAAAYLAAHLWSPKRFP